MDLSGASLEELNAELIRRTGSVDSLDSLFQLPDWVSDAELRHSYEVIVARLRRETEHLPLNTIQQLRIERIVSNYIVLRYRERTEAGEDGYAESAKGAVTYWAAITREFDAVLKAWQPKEHDAILAMVRAAVAEVIATVEDSSVRNDLVRRFPETFERMGLAPK